MKLKVDKHYLDEHGDVVVLLYVGVANAIYLVGPCELSICYDSDDFLKWREIK